MEFTAPEQGMDVVCNTMHVDVTKGHELCTSGRLALHPVIPHCCSRGGNVSGRLLFFETNISKRLH